MNRIEFMTELAALLQDVPEEERRDAMKYYNDYFDDAGEENEHQVVEELESPAKVAATIKADLGSTSKEQGEAIGILGSSARRCLPEGSIRRMGIATVTARKREALTGTIGEKAIAAIIIREAVTIRGTVTAAKDRRRQGRIVH